MNRRQFVSTITAAPVGAMAKTGVKCDFCWDDVLRSAGYLYHIALSYAQCLGMGDEETACELMKEAITQITGNNCPLLPREER